MEDNKQHTIHSDTTRVNSASLSHADSPSVTLHTKPEQNKKYRLKRFLLRQDGLLVVRLPKSVFRFFDYIRHHRIAFRILCAFVALLLLGVFIYESYIPKNTDDKYNVLPSARPLLSDPNEMYAQKLHYDKSQQSFLYNADYKPNPGAAGFSAAPKFSASFNMDPKKGVTIKDPDTESQVTFVPKYKVAEPRQDQNRLVYPLMDRQASKVYSMGGVGFKEDIVLNQFQGNEVSFEYELQLDEGLEARLQPNGSLGIFGVDKVLLGNVSTSTEKDAELLTKARNKGEKNHLIFVFPAPYIKEVGKTSSSAHAVFKLEGKKLTVFASDLDKASYPLSVDPSVYLDSATEFMRGNNESNIDFDVTNSLIQKGVLTGARYETWTPSTSLNAARWNGATVVAGGYIYVIGGSNGSTNFGNVYWAKFNTSTYAIESPTPGSSGTCTNWCTNTQYDLPSSAVRRGLQAIAYNGYLYAIGGQDSGCVGTNNRCSTVYVAKIGANGEPISWSSTTALGTARSNFGAAVYNNKIYIAGGQTNSSLNGDQSVEYASIKPDGTLGSWTASTSIPTAGRWGHSLLQYNGYLYLVGGASTTTTQATVQYIKIKSDGTLASSWTSTTSFATARATFGGSLATIWGGYMYVNGGCSTVTTTDCSSSYSTGTASQSGTTVTGSGTTFTAAMVGSQITFSTGMTATITARTSNTVITVDISQTVASTTYTIDVSSTRPQLASINADGTISDWTTFNLSGSSYYSGTASQTGTTVTGSGTTFTPAMVGMRISYGTTGTNTAIITAYNSATSLTVNTSQSVASQAFNIRGTYGRNFGTGLVAWRNTIYQIGGCAQPTASGNCTGTQGPRIFADYGTIKSDGDVSPKTNENTLPTIGNADGQVGGDNSVVVVNDGWIYSAGGCSVNNCSTMSDNTAYAQINNDGTIGTWSVDNSGLRGTAGNGAAGGAVYNNYIYMVGGTNGTAGGFTRSIWRAQLNVDTDHSVGTWTEQTNMLQTSVAGDDYGDNAGTQQLNTGGYGMMAVFTRSYNGTSGNMYLAGGCYSTAAGIGCSPIWYQNVVKCSISHTDGSISGCTETNQLQIQDLNKGVARNQGLGGMAFAMWSDYLYLVGGVCGTDSDNDNATDTSAGCDGSTSTGSPDNTFNTSEVNKVYVAKIDASGNIVKAGINANNEWQIASNTLPRPRRRGVAFAVNGYLYTAGGHDGTGGTDYTLSEVSYSKIDPTTGNLGVFGQVSQQGSTTGIISSRWGHGYVAANGYLYMVGGCSAGAPANSCSSMTGGVESLQVYNNYSGTPYQYNTTGLFTTDRYAAGSAVYNGYIYIAGGCTSTTDCTTAIDNVQYAPINDDGTIGTWNNTTDADLGTAQVRAWGKLVVVGGTLYFIGGQTSTSTDERAEVYWGTPDGSGQVSSWAQATNGLPAARTDFGVAVWNDRIYVTGGVDGSGAVSSVIYASPSLSSGGDINSAWTTTGMTAFNTARSGATAIAYSNTLYVIGGFDGSNYMIDTQYATIASDGTIGSWSYGNSLPIPVRQGSGFAANGYIYVVGGRSAATTCSTNTYVTSIAGFAPGSSSRYGIGMWSQTNISYSTNRYGAAASYYGGKVYLLGGQCNATLTGANRSYYSTLLAQPQKSTYSFYINTDIDVFANKFLFNGIDNGIGARWNLNYKSATDLTSSSCATMTDWGQNTVFNTTGIVDLGTVSTYTPKDGSGTNTNCARYYYMTVTIDSTPAFGFPEDVTRGPTITDLSLFFTANPSKRLRHGKSFTDGTQQPLDTPCGAPNC